jgi:phosphoglycolate phosphatase
MLPPAAVIFDLDGTLIDSRGDIVAAVNHALTATGRPPLPAVVIVRYIGDGARVLCARAAQLAEADPEVDTLLGRFLAYYGEHPLAFTRWQRGAQEALDELATMPDIRLGICTNKPRATTDAVLAALGIRTRFRVVVAGGDLSEKKPAPGPLLHAARLLGVAPQQIVMVGDGLQDVECARAAGARAVAVEGFTPKKRLMDAHPDVLLDSLRELPDVLRRWQDSTVRLSPVPRVRVG